MAKIIYDPPKIIGDLDNQLHIDELRVATFSFNRQKSYEQETKAVLSVGLEHPASGWMHTVTYVDADALAYAKAINTADFSAVPLDRRLLEKLIADGKVPSGQIVD